MIRVLHVFHGMNCGGAENMIMNLYRHINRESVQFDFLVHTEKKCFFDDEIESMGGHIYRAPYFNIINHFYYKKILVNFFDNHHEIKIVHGHLGSCAHIYLDIARKAGCYTIAHCHSGKPSFSLKNMAYKMVCYIVRKKADYFMACAREAGIYRYGKKIVNNMEIFCTLNNAIDIPRYTYSEAKRNHIREEFFIPDDILLIGHVGRFIEVKNHDFMIEIFKQVVQKTDKVMLMLVGEGYLQNNIRQKVRKLNLEDKVIFAGIRRDIDSIMSAFDIFIFPSIYEGLSVACIEAQAAGLPCLVSDNVSYETDITGLCKFIPIDEGEVYVEEILKTDIASRTDTRQKMTDAGYDIHKTAKWLEEFYYSRV